MIIPVEKEHENIWAEMCIELWQDLTVDSVLRMFHEGMFKNQFLYYKDGNPAAFLSLSLRSDYVEGTNTSPVGYIEGLYVKPRYRRKGIAEELIEHAKKWSEKYGCTELASDCNLENTGSQAFHKNAGFTEANKIVCYTMQI